MNAQFNTYDLNRVPLWENVPLDTPFLISLEPTFVCNFRCQYCLHSLDKQTLENRGFHFAPMAWETFENVISQLHEFPHKIKKVTFNGNGEPTMNPRLPDMVRMIMESGKVNKTLLISNGALLTPDLSDRLIDSGLSELKISLQGMSSKKYKKICGADIDFDKFVEQIRYFSKHRGNCVLRLKMADVSLEEGEEQSFYDTFGDLCDFISIEHIYAQFNGVSEGMLPDHGKNRFGFPYAQKKVCAQLFFKINVLQSGDIIFGFPDGIAYEGFNVQNMTLCQAWNSPERKRLLYDHLTGDHGSRMCGVCTRWSYGTTPMDDLDGHEAEILQHLNLAEYNIPRENLHEETVRCFSNAFE